MGQESRRRVPKLEEAYKFAALHLRGMAKTNAAMSAWPHLSRSHAWKMAKAVMANGMYETAVQDIRKGLKATVKGEIMDLKEAAKILTHIGRAKVGHYLDKDFRIDAEKVAKKGGQDILEYREIHTPDTIVRKLRLRDPVQAIERISKMAGWDAPDVTKHVFDHPVADNKEAAVSSVIDDLWQQETRPLPPGQTIDVLAEAGEREVADAAVLSPAVGTIEQALDDDSPEEEPDLDDDIQPEQKLLPAAPPLAKSKPRKPGRPSPWQLRKAKQEKTKKSRSR